MKQKVLILGCTGMLGHTLLSRLSEDSDLDVYGTARSSSQLDEWFPSKVINKIRTNVDVDNFETVTEAFASIQPDVVINCIGLIKQLPTAKEPLLAISLNSLLPHRIASMCKTTGARMIHISTDCVFNGKKGNYMESDPSDATELYGRSKFLGEVEYPHCVTLRTSIIGHELKGKFGLVEWFLDQKNRVNGYANAIYTGFTTDELTKIIRDYVLPNKELFGVYHVSSDPVSKYDLLKLVAERYGMKIEINRDEEFSLNRSLDSTRFKSITAYRSPSWPELIDGMYQNYINSNHYRK